MYILYRFFSESKYDSSDFGSRSCSFFSRNCFSYFSFLNICYPSLLTSCHCWVTAGYWRGTTSAPLPPTMAPPAAKKARLSSGKDGGSATKGRKSTGAAGGAAGGSEPEAVRPGVEGVAGRLGQAAVAAAVAGRKVSAAWSAMDKRLAKQASAVQRGLPFNSVSKYTVGMKLLLPETIYGNAASVSPCFLFTLSKFSNFTAV